MAGTLYVVATPIGNLEDITYRAVRILREVDLIACEDTRESHKLLDHYGIRKPLISYHDHNEAARAAELVERLAGGESVALISDAGTPLVSDPGYRLIHQAIAAEFRVIPIPGPSAALAALSASGLPTDEFRFCGFLPPKQSQRRRHLELLADEETTLIFYEAPHRILEALGDIVAILGDRPTVVARELTKLHEELLRGNADAVRQELARRPALKGELTLLIGKGERPADPRTTRELVDELMRAGTPRMAAIKQAARLRGISKRDAYTELEQDP
ncbi:MAG TPA: 16S rRNA (cytidine(1402)-2'-O)-methyltransferase [Solibacterales bacterium]|nr:16S rRNA (cytidine(1402)-2'-O)-methyltransferase [Bryobacterales bacterium]